MSDKFVEYRNCSKATFESISHDDDTLYFIKDTGEIYKGDVNYGGSGGGGSEGAWYTVAVGFLGSSYVGILSDIYNDLTDYELGSIDSGGTIEEDALAIDDDTVVKVDGNVLTLGTDYTYEIGIADELMPYLPKTTITFLSSVSGTVTVSGHVLRMHSNAPIFEGSDYLLPEAHEGDSENPAVRVDSETFIDAVKSQSNMKIRWAISSSLNALIQGGLSELGGFAYVGDGTTKEFSIAGWSGEQSADSVYVTINLELVDSAGYSVDFENSKIIFNQAPDDGVYIDIMPINIFYSNNTASGLEFQSISTAMGTLLSVLPSDISEIFTLAGWDVLNTFSTPAFNIPIFGGEFWSASSYSEMGRIVFYGGSHSVPID